MIPTELQTPSKRKPYFVLGAIVLITALIIFLLIVLKPEAKKRDIPETIVTVESITATKTNYPVRVFATGTIIAETQGNLMAQIRGEITYTSDNFKNGGSFEKGEVLAKIDARDYQAALSQATANLSQAQVAYQQEQANAKQALKDWKRLGNTQTAPDLVLRKPQLIAAKANLTSAQASHQTALLNLERTKITAPYQGRVINRNAVLGQYVSTGAPLAEVYAREGIEVRLPISQNEFTQLGLNRFGQKDAPVFAIKISADDGINQRPFSAVLSRTDSGFDINTRQIDVIAKIDVGTLPTNAQSSLKIGQFVSATISGQELKGVFVVPNRSIREGQYLYVVQQGILVKKAIHTIWQDDSYTVIDKGLSDDDIIVTTALNSTLEGAKAQLANKQAESAPSDS